MVFFFHFLSKVTIKLKENKTTIGEGGGPNKHRSTVITVREINRKLIQNDGKEMAALMVICDA